MAPVGCLKLAVPAGSPFTDVRCKDDAVAQSRRAQRSPETPPGWASTPQRDFYNGHMRAAALHMQEDKRDPNMPGLQHDRRLRASPQSRGLGRRRRRLPPPRSSRFKICTAACTAQRVAPRLSRRKGRTCRRAVWDSMRAGRSTGRRKSYGGCYRPANPRVRASMRMGSHGQ